MNSRIPTAEIVFSLVLCSWTPLIGQPAHDKGLDLHPVNPPRASYVIRAELKPDSTMVRGEVELDYRNLSPDTLPSLLLAFPQAGSGRGTIGVIDSLLVNGVPVAGLRHDTSMVSEVTLPVALLPGQTVHVLLSYQCRILRFAPGRDSPLVLALVDWYPRIQPRARREWYARDTISHQIYPGESADYAVSLTMDSGWMAAGTGEILNERELLGVLPRRTDTTLVEALAHPEKEGSMTFGSLPPRDGERTWLWRAAHACGFSVAVSRGWKLDRIVADSCVVDMFYDKDRRWVGREKRDEDVLSLVKKLNRIAGTPAFRQTALVDGAAIDPEHESDLPILLSSRVLGEANREVSLAVKLAQLWTRPILPDPQGRLDPSLQQGIANYLAIEALHQLDSTHGYDEYCRYADRMIDAHDELSLLSGNRPFGWMNRVKAPHRVSRQDTLRFLQWYRVPGQLQLLRAYLGDLDFFGGLQRSLSPESTGYSTDFYWRHLFDSSQKDVDWFFGGGSLIESMDWRLTNVRSHTNDSGVSVSGSVEGIIFPCDLTLGFVFSSADTVFRPLVLRNLGSPREVPFSVLLPKLPREVILDPHYDYPDAHRDNNYFFFELGSGFREPMSQVFPGYRRLRLGP